MNHPKQLRYQRLLPLLVCTLFFATASTSLLGQQFIPRTYPTYQQPSYTPVYPSQPVQIVQPQYQAQQGTIIYGQPVPVQNGQIINGQVTQPGVIFTPPSTQPAKQDAGDTAKIKQDEEAKRLEKIERLEKIKRLIDENKRLQALALDDGKQSQEIQRLEGELRQATLKLSEMQKSVAANSDDTSSATMALNGKIQQQQQEIQQLSANYQQAVQQNKVLTGQIETLNDESSKLKAQLSQLSQRIKPDDSQGEMGLELQQLQSNLTTTSTALNDVRQQNEAMTSEYNRLQGLYESGNADNAKLSQRIDELSSENQRFAARLSEYTNAEDVSAIADDNFVEDAQTSIAASRISTNRDVDTKTSLTADRGLAVSGLKRKNRQLLSLNEQAKQKNELLKRRISELEGTVNELSIDNDDRKSATTGLASNFVGVLSDSDQVDALTGKYNIMSWLIPFLGIGLTIGLYVFLTEEYRGTSQSWVTGGDTRDDR